MSKHCVDYSPARGLPFGGYDFVNGMSMLEKERAHWEREKELQHQQWLKYEEDCERWIKKRYTLLQKMEDASTLREQELARREKEVGKREKALEEETKKLSEQYKRVKKLERQGKRREERIEKAKQQLQHQAHEHFSVIYTTLQLGLKSLSLPNQTPSESSYVASSPLEYIKSPPPFNSVSSICPQIEHRHPSLEPLATKNGSPLLRFGKIKAPRSVNTSAPVHTALSNEHSPCGCIPQHKNENDTDKLDTSFEVKRTLYQMVEDNETSDDVVSNLVSSEATPAPPFVEVVSLVSTERDPLHGATSIIDSGASLTEVNAKLAKKLNGKYSTDDEDTPMLVCNCTATLFPSGNSTRSLLRFNKYNPHVDWGPLF